MRNKLQIILEADGATLDKVQIRLHNPRKTSERTTNGKSELRQMQG